MPKRFAKMRYNPTSEDKLEYFKRFVRECRAKNITVLAKPFDYKNAHSPLLIKCNVCGHKWAPPSFRIHQGSGCNKCADKVRANWIRGSIDDLKATCKNRNIGILAKRTDYEGRNSPLPFQCIKCKCVWDATPSNILRGRGCPNCAGKRPSIEKLQRLADSRSETVLSKKYEGDKVKIRVRCPKNHPYEVTPSHYRLGSGCPKCKHSKSETICRQFFEKIFEKPFPTLKPTWLLNKDERRMELDGYNVELGLAFEYNKAQHYKELKRYQKKKPLIERQRDDALKKRNCELNSVTLIVVPYWVPVDEMQEFITNKCRSKGVKVPKIGKIDFTKFSTGNELQTKQLREILLDKGYELKSPYIKQNTKVKILCARGHSFDAYPDNVKRGHGCPECAGVRKPTIEEVRDYAEKHGAVCTSQFYKNNKALLNFKCKRANHPFQIGFKYFRMCIQIHKISPCPNKECRDIYRKENR